MALIYCPECNGKVSDSVNNCPHCGYRLINKIEGNKKEKIIATIFFFATILMIVGGGVGFLIYLLKFISINRDLAYSAGTSLYSWHIELRDFYRVMIVVYAIIGIIGGVGLFFAKQYKEKVGWLLRG